MAPFPIDYDAVRVALVDSVRRATGLSQNAVLVAEPETPVSVRPEVPFAALKLTSTSIKFGWDSLQHAGLVGDDEGVFTYSGPRALICSFDFYGATHEQAYGLAAQYQAALDQEEIWGALDERGLAVWRVDQVVDLSALLSTGYEGRAHLTVQFGLAAVSSVNIGFIEHVPTAGTVQGANGAAENVVFTADLRED